MSDWEDIANALWNDIRRWVQNQKDSGHTLASIAEKIGVKNRSHISLWLSGERSHMIANTGASIVFISCSCKSTNRNV